MSARETSQPESFPSDVEGATCLIREMAIYGNYACPKVLMVMDPRVFKLRSAGTPHGNLRCGAIRTAEEGLEDTGRHRTGRAGAEDGPGAIQTKDNRRRCGLGGCGAKRSGRGERRGGSGTERRTITPSELNTRNDSHWCGGGGAACGYQRHVYQSRPCPVLGCVDPLVFALSMAPQ